MIGVYEEAWVILADGTEHNGSPLTLGSALEQPDRVALHERCYGTLRADPRDP